MNIYAEMSWSLVGQLLALTGGVTLLAAALIVVVVGVLSR